jgi:TonB family protein
MLAGILFALIGASSAPLAAPAPAVTVQATDTAGLSKPASIGRPHSCPENQYPVSALQTGTEGDTFVKFTITAEGRVADVSLRTSSGNADLDAAAMTCARDWLYQPALQNGTPVAVPWTAEVRWQISVTEPYAALDAASLACIKADSVTWDEYKKAALHTVVRVHFANGAVSDVIVAGSSGDPDLDSRVTACYRSVPPELTANVPDGDELFVAML